MTITKSDIVAKASEKFVREGCRRVTMDDISKELRISKRTLYETFANKEVLLEAVLIDIKELMRQSQAKYFEKVREKGANPLYAMLFTMNNYGQFYERYSLLVNDVARSYPELMEKHFWPKANAMKENLKQNLAQMQREGYLRDNTDIELAAETLAMFVMQPLKNTNESFDHNASVACELSFTYIRGLLKTEHIARYEQEEDWMRKNLTN
jgi:AcrR family transcriptional regulator